jgi:ankyrin repeat protein
MVKELLSDYNRFLWVKFQLDDLCDAESDAEIKRALNNLPKDLSETYARLLKRITGSQRQELAKRMFQWIICARRPLHVKELREAIAFTINDQFFDREKLPTDMPRLIRGCGNLVVIDEDTEQVQLAHYTVQQYILLKEGMSQDPCQPYCFTYDEANNAIGETCIAYLSFSDFERQVSRAINKPMVEMAVLQRATATGTTTNLGLLGNKMRQVISLAHKPSTSSCAASLKIDYQRLLPRHRPPSNIFTRTYHLLNYVIDNWLSHIIAFKSTSTSKQRDRMFEALVVEKNLPFTFRPWESSTVEGNIDNLCLLGWVLENDHVPTLQAISCSLLDDLWALELLLEACIAEKYFNNEPRIQKERMVVLNSLAQLRTIVGAGRNEELAWLYSKLILACRNGNLQVLHYCFASQAQWFRYTFAIGHMLCEAAAYGHEEVVEWLVDTSIWGNYHSSPWLPTCNYLIDEYETHYFNPLEIAILRGYPRIAIIIKEQLPEKLECHSLFDILSNHMDDVLKNDAVVDAILQAIDPQTTKEKEVLHLLHYNALSQAARSGDAPHIARYERSFKLEEPVKDGLTPLSSAILEGNTPLIRVLVNLGADTQALLSTTSKNRPALIKLFNTQALFKVLEDDIEYAIRDTAFFDAMLEILDPTMKLFLVLKEGNKSRINELIQVLQIAGPHGVPSQTLVSAISESRADPARIVDLLNAETYINQLEVAAWYAIRVNDLRCLRLLTKMGATLATRDENSLSTLEYAVQNKQQEIFFFLLQMSGTILEEIPCSEESFELATGRQWVPRPEDLEIIADYCQRSKQPPPYPTYQSW